ncbi:hypothetical protein [Arcobacter aquimarinus]|uniref:hypothetical protein n=1 Tax=Arcobacter aquimarinus TaxID=1315211 RepID=UPI003BB13800
MNDYNQILSENLRYFEELNVKHKIYSSIDEMLFDFSGIFITLNSFNESDYTFRLMGTYKKREEKTKKKQLYSLGLKSVKDIGTDKAIQIKKEFEKLVLVFTQMRYYQDIKDVEEKKRDL